MEKNNMNINDANITENEGLKNSADNAQTLDKETAEIYMPCVIVNRGSIGSSKISCDNHRTLNQLLERGEKPSKEHRASILLHMSHCLSRLAQNQIDINELSLSQVLVRGRRPETPSACKIDIQHLARLYYDVLTGWKLDEHSSKFSNENCEDPYTADDLITKMFTSKKISTIEDVLKHPFHWSEKEKINFIRQAFDYVYPDYNFGPILREGVDKKAGKHDLDDRTDIFPEYGWLEVIKLKPEELRIIGKHESVKNLKVSIGVETIYKTAFTEETEKNEETKKTENTKKYKKTKKNKKTKKAKKAEKTKKEEQAKLKMKDAEEQSGEGIPKFNKNSILDLMRFFRNYHVHYWDNDQAVQLAFGSHFKGYWKFYSTRFPKLFIHVYNKMNKCMLVDNVLEEDFSFYGNL